MPKKCRWTNEELSAAVKNNASYRQVIYQLGLIPAGGNYEHVVRRVKELELDVAHFHGKGWNKGWKFDPRKPKTPLKTWLVKGSTVQSFTLKRRLLQESIKTPICELCGWSEKSVDGRIPIELDHINGQKDDNRIENLRILCPNCHSLQSTHRGRNKKVRYARVL
jgi:5-methylcytosine-specific restriction endonuclease McrA